MRISKLLIVFGVCAVLMPLQANAQSKNETKEEKGKIWSVFKKDEAAAKSNDKDKNEQKKLNFLHKDAKKEVKATKKERKAAEKRERAARARAEVIKAEKRALRRDRKADKAEEKAIKTREKLGSKS